MSYSHNKRKKMRRRMRRFPHAFTGEPTIPFVLASSWNLSKKSTREYLTAPKSFL